MTRRLLAITLLVACPLTPALAQAKPQTDMSNMDMSSHDMSNMNHSDGQSMTGMDDGSTHAMKSMEGRHMDMGPHMKMTILRDLKPGDLEKANQIAAAAKKAAEKYTDYKTALADGYEIFLPNVPQKQYHFTNKRYGFEAALHFNPDHPTSLLYEKQGDGYKLVGVMYTDRKGASEDELNSRIPLSIAQWHAHVNLCLPPQEKRAEMLQDHSPFGMHGSIATKEACDAAGGRFLPQVFGWMVHVYPFEQNPADVWSVERQGREHMD